MALIKCPECEKEISSLAKSCPNCGYPIKNVEIETPLSASDKVASIFESFFSNLSENRKDLNVVYDAVRTQTEKISKLEIDNDETQNEIDCIAEIIINSIIENISHCNWMTCKRFCELIDFSKLSKDCLTRITESLYNMISYKEVYSDGSRGNTKYIILAYPLFETISYGGRHNAVKLMEILKEPCSRDMTNYEYMLLTLLNNGNVKTFELNPSDRDRLISEEKRIKEEYLSARKMTAPKRQKQAIEELRNKIKEKKKSSLGFGISALISLILLIWSFSESEDGSLGFIVVLSLFGLILFGINFFSSIQEWNTAEDDLITAKESVDKYEKVASQRLEEQFTELINTQNKINAKAERDHPVCPACGSRNTNRISTTNRAISVAALGLASSKIGKQYECKTCKHKW